MPTKNNIGGKQTFKIRAEGIDYRLPYLCLFQVRAQDLQSHFRVTSRAIVQLGKPDNHFECSLSGVDSARLIAFSNATDLEAWVSLVGLDSKLGSGNFFSNELRLIPRLLERVVKIQPSVVHFSPPAIDRQHDVVFSNRS